MFKVSDFEKLVRGEYGDPAALADRLGPRLTRKDNALLAAAMVCREQQVDDSSVSAISDAQVLENLLGSLAGERDRVGVLLNRSEVEAIAAASGEHELLSLPPAINVGGEPKWLKNDAMACYHL